MDQQDNKDKKFIMLTSSYYVRNTLVNDVNDNIKKGYTPLEAIKCFLPGKSFNMSEAHCYISMIKNDS